MSLAMIEQAPTDSDVIRRRFLAAAHLSRHRYGEALDLLEGLGNDTPEIVSDRGLAFAGLGRHAEALVQHRRAITLAPEGMAGHNNLGLSLLALGCKEEALAAFETALGLAPASLEALTNLGRVCAGLGRKTLARTTLERALEIDPSYAPAYRDLVELLLEAEDAEAALDLAEAALRRVPDDADALFDAGRALMLLSREGAALSRFDQAIALRPEFDRAHLKRGVALSELGRHAEAISCVDAVLVRRPDMIAAHCCAGRVLAEAERHDDALLRFDTALALDPSSVAALMGRSATLRTIGRLDEARATLRQAVEIDPDDPNCWYQYAETKRFRPGDPDLATLEALEGRAAQMAPSARMYLHYALAKAYRDVGRHKRVVDHVVAGGVLKRKEAPYNETATLAMFRRVAEVFTPEALAAQAGLGDPSDVPVFIVGMPRSGTTLIEQILASHPGVHGAGELSVARQGAAALRSDDGRAAYPDIVPTLSAEKLQAMGAHYIARAHADAPDALRVTDKLPENFVHLGLIRLMLPNARIIHARRHPADSCLSCFFTLFAHLGFTFDMRDLGRYYAGYDALMAHWRAVLPARAMLEIRYEEVVADLDAQARRIVAFCGLSWDDRCLAFHETRRPVRTASVTQVRRPLYATSVGQWRPYRRLLAPLFDEIAPVIERYGRREEALAGAVSSARLRSR